MPLSIAFILAATPILGLSLLANLTPDVISVLRLALILSCIVAVLWVVTDVLGNMRAAWRRFVSRPF